MLQINETDIEFGRWQQRWWKLRIAIGQMINRFVIPARELDLIDRRANVLAARSPGARLSSNEIARLRKYMLDVQDRDLRREYFQTTPITRTFQGLLLPLIAQVVAEDKSIRSIVNIGTSYAHIDGLMARQYPDINFTTVDFASNLAEYNKEFECNNLTFRSGYAMEMLERKELIGDVFFFGNAAYEIKNQELRRYFGLFRDNGAKYVVLNEPIYPLPGGAIIDPLDVSLEESRPVYSHQGLGTSRHGPLGRVHNYKAMLEEAGFEVIHYQAFRPEFTDLRVVRAIGRRP